MSLVTATQTCNPFQRHVTFNTGNASLGPQSTTTSPGHQLRSTTHLSPTHPATPTNPTDDPTQRSPNPSTLAVVTAASAPSVHPRNSDYTAASDHTSPSAMDDTPNPNTMSVDEPPPHDHAPSHTDSSSTPMPPLEDPHADVINDLDPMDDNAPTVASQISPIAAAGAPSDHSQADADTQSVVTAHRARSLAPNNDDTSYAKSQASPTLNHNTMDDLSASTTRSSKCSGDALDLSTLPL